MRPTYLERAHSWLTNDFDEQTRDEVKYLIENNQKELEDSFYKSLEFGTGGLRGIMGPGTNRMNRYTVGMATQGLVNYIFKVFGKREQHSVAISYDCRNNSRLFAEITAGVFAANGFKVYLFDEMRPTPELSYAIRHYRCVAGVMITASHNPKEYNGYKAYWSDGAQVTSPHDQNIISEVLLVDEPSKVRFSGGQGAIVSVGEEFDDAYLEAILSLTLSRDLVRKDNSLKIVYSPIHGTGVKIVPEALRRMGFVNIINVPEQDVADGNFPTVKYPNPEEKDALQMAIDKAVQTGADILMATDPDADRLGVAVRTQEGAYEILNGNQTATILTYYLLERSRELGLLKGGANTNSYMVKTIVTTDLLRAISESYGVEMMNVLTGFKYIAEVVRNLEGKRKFIGGGEESYGFNAGEFVRDKDAVLACSLFAEASVWASNKGMTLSDLLKHIYIRFGFYKEHLISITKKGKDGLEQIASMMKSFRSSPPQQLAGSRVVLVHDYLRSETIDMVSDLRYKINLPESDVLQFISADNTVISVRPSGTEPKIKFYFGVKASLSSPEDFKQTEEFLNKKIELLADQIMSYNTPSQA